MKKLSLLFVIVSLLSVSACKKEEDKTTTPALTKSQMLTAKTWKLTSLTVSPAYNFNGTMITDYYSVMEACEKDDIYKYNTDKTFTSEEGATKCDPSDPQIIDAGTWTLSADEKQLIETSSGTTITYNIVELTSTKFVTTYTEVENGVTYTYTDTHTAQ